MIASAFERRRVGGVLWGLAAGLWCLEALATPKAFIALDYSAPNECPEESQVIARTVARVQHQPAVPVAATATITERSGSYILELNVEGGRRLIASPSCESLVQTLTVILALAIDPHAQSETLSPDLTEHTAAQATPSAAGAELLHVAPATGGSVASSTEVTNTPKGRPLAPSSAEPRRQPAILTPKGAATRANPKPGSNEPDSAKEQRAKEKELGTTSDEGAKRPRIGPSMLLRTEYGMLPSLALGPSLGWWVEGRDWSFAGTAIWLLPQFAQVSGINERRGGSISFLGMELDICRLILRSLQVGACAGIEYGDLMGMGAGVQNTKLGHGFWLAGTVGLVQRSRIWSKLGGDLRLGIAIPAMRPAFGLDGYHWRFEPRAWSLRFGVGLSWK